MRAERHEVEEQHALGVASSFIRAQRVLVSYEGMEEKHVEKPGGHADQEEHADQEQGMELGVEEEHEQQQQQQQQKHQQHHQQHKQQHQQHQQQHHQQQQAATTTKAAKAHTITHVMATASASLTKPGGSEAVGGSTR